MGVLVVDDEPQIVRALAINLRARHYEVHVASSGAEALSLAAKLLTAPELPADVHRSARRWLGIS